MRSILDRWPLIGLAALAAGCSGGVDWHEPENLVRSERSSEVDDGVKLEYTSLVDAPCAKIYDAIADVEHYPEFVSGVDSVSLLSSTDTTKTVQIAQRVIGRQSNAKVEWRFFPAERKVEFHTLSSSLSINDGSYTMTGSPDGTRCLVASTFLVKEASGNKTPMGVLASGTRDSFLAAAEGVRKRATEKSS